MVNNNKNLLKEFRKDSFEILSNLNIHGISKIIKTKNLALRLLWAISVIVSYSYCAYSVMQNTLDYLKYPVIKKYGQIYEKEPNFPAITFCNFNTSIYRCIFNDKNCSSTHIRVKNDKCYTFNSGTNKTIDPIQILRSKQAGYRFAFKLGLYRLNANKDISIYIHNQSCNFNEKKEIRVSPGMQKNIVFNRIFQKRLDAPYSKCRKKVSHDCGEKYKTDIKSHPYFQSECFMTCKLRRIANSCNMSAEFEKYVQYYYTNDYYFWSFYNSMEKNCSLKNSSLIRQVNEIFLSEGENVVCEESCPIECNSVTYETSVNSILLNANTVISEFQNDIRNLSYINIYYEDFSYKSISEIPKTSFEDLLGTIGGLIGMFLGTSLLSFIEVPDILLQMFFRSFDRAKRTNELESTDMTLSNNHGTPEITRYFNREKV